MASIALKRPSVVQTGSPDGIGVTRAKNLAAKGYNGHGINTSDKPRVGLLEEDSKDDNRLSPSQEGLHKQTLMMIKMSSETSSRRLSQDLLMKLN